MEKKWQKRRERSARIKLFFKRVRLPLLTVGGTFLTAFIIIPLALGAYEARAESIEVTAPNKQAQPSVQVGDIQIATPEPVMTAEPTPAENTADFISRRTPSPVRSASCPWSSRIHTATASSFR